MSDMGIIRARWSCPICERSRTRVFVEDPAAPAPIEARLLAGLKTHIAVTHDEAHGGFRRVPGSINDDDLRELIEVDE